MEIGAAISVDMGDTPGMYGMGTPPGVWGQYT